LLKRVSDLESAIIEFNRSYSALEAHFKAVQHEVNDYKQQYETIQSTHALDSKPASKDLNMEVEPQPRPNSKNQTQQSMNLNINYSQPIQTHIP
jgi:hypothetical protein